MTRLSGRGWGLGAQAGGRELISTMVECCVGGGLMMETGREQDERTQSGEIEGHVLMVDA